MDANELKEIRKRLDWTWKRLAAELSVNWRTVAAWERNEARISGPVALAIRGLAQQHEEEKRK
jgi:DNA-binding transcriptional regulator YiaG